MQVKKQNQGESEVLEPAGAPEDLRIDDTEKSAFEETIRKSKMGMKRANIVRSKRMPKNVRSARIGIQK